MVTTIKTSLKEQKLFKGKACVADAIQAITELNGKIDSTDLDTNGWSVDFWLKCKLFNKKYMVAGSMFYGTLEIGLYTD